MDTNSNNNEKQDNNKKFEELLSKIDSEDLKKINSAGELINSVAVNNRVLSERSGTNSKYLRSILGEKKP